MFSIVDDMALLCILYVSRKWFHACSRAHQIQVVYEGAGPTAWAQRNSMVAGDPRGLRVSNGSHVTVLPVCSQVF